MLTMPAQTCSTKSINTNTNSPGSGWAPYDADDARFVVVALIGTNSTHNGRLLASRQRLSRFTCVLGPGKSVLRASDARMPHGHAPRRLAHLHQPTPRRALPLLWHVCPSRDSEALCTARRRPRLVCDPRDPNFSIFFDPGLPLHSAIHGTPPRPRNYLDQRSLPGTRDNFTCLRPRDLGSSSSTNTSPRFPEHAHGNTYHPTVARLQRRQLPFTHPAAAAQTAYVLHRQTLEATIPLCRASALGCMRARHSAELTC